MSINHTTKKVMEALEYRLLKMGCQVAVSEAWDYKLNILGPFSVKMSVEVDAHWYFQDGTARLALDESEKGFIRYSTEFGCHPYKPVEGKIVLDAKGRKNWKKAVDELAMKVMSRLVSRAFNSEWEPC